MIRNGSAHKSQTNGTLWIHIFLIAFTGLTLFPILGVLRAAFDAQGGMSTSLGLFPEVPTLEHFETLLTERSASGELVFMSHLTNSIVVSLATTIAGIFLACTAAYAFSRFEFTGRKTGLMGFLVSQMFPGVLTLAPLYVLLNSMGLINELAGLIVVYSTTSIPFCVWMLKGYFDTIPKDLEESALIDGASQFTIFWRIILPLAAPAVAVTALFSFMTAWNEFILASVFMTEASAYTLPVKINSYVNNEEIRWGLFAASSLLVSLPVMGLFYSLQKYLVGGLTAGAVKG